MVLVLVLEEAVSSLDDPDQNQLRSLVFGSEPSEPFGSLRQERRGAGPVPQVHLDLIKVVVWPVSPTHS